MTDPDAPSRAEDLQIREALGYLTSVTKWLAANAPAAEAAVAQADELARLTSGTAYVARNLKIATAAAGPERVRFDRTGTSLALSILQEAMAQADRAGSYLAARDALLLGFYVSEPTYRLLAEHYRAFVTTMAAHAAAHPRLLTEMCRKLVRAIAEDLRDVDMGDEGKKLAAALG